MKKLIVFSLLIVLSVALSPVLSRGEQAQNGPSPVYNTDNYQFPPSGEIEDRVFPAPQFVLDHFAKIDKDLIPPDKPYKAYEPAPGEMKEIKSVISQMPNGYKKAISPRLLGIYFVENLIGSGWSEWMRGKDGSMYYIMLFNSSVLKKDASRWITDKERTVFISEPGYELTIDIGSGMSGFYYIFYHEISHVYDYVAQVTPGEENMESVPLFEMLPKSRANAKKYPFVHNVWLKYTLPVKEYDFSGRGDITFYGLSGGPKIKISEAPAYYESLKTTPFVTLYGAQSWMEDFAEFMAAYMNSVVLKRPWVLRISKDGKIIYEMNGVFDRKLMEARMKFAESLVK